MKVIITMPAYRAARTMEKTLREIPRDCFDDVLVVDDASPDDTVAVARSLGLKTRQHPANGVVAPLLAEREIYLWWWPR